MLLQQFIYIFKILSPGKCGHICKFSSLMNLFSLFSFFLPQYPQLAVRMPKQFATSMPASVWWQQGFFLRQASMAGWCQDWIAHSFSFPPSREYQQKLSEGKIKISSMGGIFESSSSYAFSLAFCILNTLSLSDFHTGKAL